MEYTYKAMKLVTGEEVTVTKNARPGCPGAFRTDAGLCAQRPDHVVRYVINPSGLPDSGTPRTVTVCYRHLHGVLKHVEGIGRYATVMAYDGI